MLLLSKLEHHVHHVGIKELKMLLLMCWWKNQKMLALMIFCNIMMEHMMSDLELISSTKQNWLILCISSHLPISLCISSKQFTRYDHTLMKFRAEKTWDLGRSDYRRASGLFTFCAVFSNLDPYVTMYSTLVSWDPTGIRFGPSTGSLPWWVSQ